MTSAATARTYSSPLRAEQAEQTRDRIVQAAVDLLAEGDAGDLSMPDVAERAGVSVRTVYRSFATKDELLDGVIEWINDHIDQVAGPRAGDARGLRGDDRRRDRRAVRDRAALPGAVRHPGRARVAPPHRADAPGEHRSAPTPPRSRASTTHAARRLGGRAAPGGVVERGAVHEGLLGPVAGGRRAGHASGRSGCWPTRPATRRRGRDCDRAKARPSPGRRRRAASGSWRPSTCRVRCRACSRSGRRRRFAAGSSRRRSATGCRSTTSTSGSSTTTATCGCGRSARPSRSPARRAAHRRGS